MMTFDVKIHSGFSTLSPEWPDGSNEPMAVATYHVFQTLPFLKLSWETFGGPSRARLCMIEVRGADGQPLIFAPFCITRRNGVRILSFVDAHAADYNAPVIFASAPAWTRELADQLYCAIWKVMPRHDLVKLEKMPPTIGDHVNPFYLLADGPDAVSCHGNDLRRSWEEIDKAVPWRKTLLKKIRALDRIAPVKFTVAETEAERGVIIEKLLEQKQRRFEQTKVPGFDADPAKRRFFFNGATVFGEIDMLHLCCLRVGDRIVATCFGLVQNGCYYGLMIGFDGGEWSNYSVGRIIYYKMLEWLHANGFHFMDLGVGDEGWKIEHADVTIPLARKTEAVTWQGRGFSQAGKAMDAIRSTRVWQKIRPLKWVALRAVRKKRGIA